MSNPSGGVSHDLALRHLPIPAKAPGPARLLQAGEHYRILGQVAGGDCRVWRIQA